MTEKFQDPFEDLPAEGTPEQFFECVRSALRWMEPHLDDKNIHHATLKGYCRAYTRLVYPDAQTQSNSSGLPPHLTEQQIVMKQRQIVTVFRQIKDQIVGAQALAQAAKQSKSQSERASKPRKLDEQQHKRIASAYWALSEGGRATRGGVKELAGRYDISPEMVRKIAKKYPPN